MLLFFVVDVIVVGGGHCCCCSCCFSCGWWWLFLLLLFQFFVVVDVVAVEVGVVDVVAFAGIDFVAVEVGVAVVDFASVTVAVVAIFALVGAHNLVHLCSLETIYLLLSFSCGFHELLLLYKCFLLTILH